GDIKAQIGALTTGVRRLTLLLDRHGRETVDEAIAELRRRSERMMRAQIDSIPDGRYDSVAYLDSDGVVNEPLEIRLAATVKGSEIDFDFSGSSPPCAGPLNSVWATTLSSVYVAMKHIFPEIPINAGCFAPIKVKPPKGTFLLAEYPRPVAGCAAEVSQRIIEAVFLALARAIPERLFAAPAGTSGNFSLGGYDPGERRNYGMYLFSGGGYGGWWAGDGISNGCSTIGISKTQPIEVLEQRYPILFETYALREGSGGAGKFRGGFGVGYRVKVLRGEGKASFLMGHGRVCPPPVPAGHPRPARAARRQARRPQRDPFASGQQRDGTRASLQGRGLCAQSRRLSRGGYAGWRRVRRPGCARSGARRARSQSRLFFGLRGKETM